MQRLFLPNNVIPFCFFRESVLYFPVFLGLYMYTFLLQDSWDSARTLKKSPMNKSDSSFEQFIYFLHCFELSTNSCT